MLNRLIIDSFILLIRQTLNAILGWLFGFPLTYIIKRNPNLIIVIGRHGRVFADNSKYFFIYATELALEGDRVIFLTTNRFIQKNIFDAGGSSVLHPSWRSFYLLLKCGKVVADMDWFNYGIYPLTRGAKLVQIWHGAPLKFIELDLYQKDLARLPACLRPFFKIQKALIGRYPFYDIVVATSQWFISEAFQSCFKARQFIATGYPRNDILFGWPPTDSIAYRLARINVDSQAMEAVASARAKGQKICLYVPTYRKDMANPFEGAIDLARFSAFSKQNNLFVVLKLHPFMCGHYRINQYPNLREYSPIGDVYPLMPMCDFRITDYSSIFFDFLLLDKPIIFFPYDLNRYLSQDRDMYFDYDEMTPGVKCFSYDELELRIKAVIEIGYRDEYTEMRKKVGVYTHDHEDNQSAFRLIDTIKKYL